MKFPLQVKDQTIESPPFVISKWFLSVVASKARIGIRGSQNRNKRQPEEEALREHRRKPEAARMTIG